MKIISIHERKCKTFKYYPTLLVTSISYYDARYANNERIKNPQVISILAMFIAHISANILFKFVHTKKMIVERARANTIWHHHNHACSRVTLLLYTEN